MNAKFFRNGIVMLVLVVGTVALLYTWLIQGTPGTPTGYSQFLADVQTGKVQKVIQQDQSLTVTYNDGSTKQVVVPSILTEVYQDMLVAARAGNQTLPASIFAEREGGRHVVARVTADGPVAGHPDRRLHLLHDETGPGHQ